jgi:hypothetical protein
MQDQIIVGRKGGQPKIDSDETTFGATPALARKTARRSMMS